MERILTLPHFRALTVLRIEATATSVFLFYGITQKRPRQLQSGEFSQGSHQGMPEVMISCFIGCEGYLDKVEGQMHSFCMLESTRAQQHMFSLSSQSCVIFCLLRRVKPQSIWVFKGDGSREPSFVFL